MAKLDLCYIRINVNPELNLLQLCARRETGIDTHKHMEFGGGRMMNRGGKGEEDKQEDGDNGLYVYDVCPFYVQTEASDNQSDYSLPPSTCCSLTLISILCHYVCMCHHITSSRQPTPGAQSQHQLCDSSAGIRRSMDTGTTEHLRNQRSINRKGDAESENERKRQRENIRPQQCEDCRSS